MSAKQTGAGSRSSSFGRTGSVGRTGTVGRTGVIGRTGSATRTRTTVRATRRPRLVAALLAVSFAARRVVAALGAARRSVAGAVTPAGWIVVVAALVGTGAGFVLGWIEWVAAGIVGIVLLLFAAPFLFGARAYEVDVTLAHDRVVAGSALSGDVHVHNRTTRIALPGRVDLPIGDGLVELAIPMLRADHSVSNPIELPAMRRGILTVGPAIVVRADPVGLLRREHRWSEARDVFVHPKTIALPTAGAGLIRDLEGNPTRHLVDSDMSFHAIRPYSPGDSQRQIHWKSTAKTGQLMVRQYEESRRSHTAIALSTQAADYADAEEFELAVSVAASLGVQALREARDLDVVTGVEIPRVARGRVRSIAHLSTVTPRTLLDDFAGADLHENTLALEGVCALQAEAADGVSIAFVVCGSRTDLIRLRRAALAYSSSTSVIAIVCDESAHPRVRPVSSMTVMTVGMLGDLPALLTRGWSA